MTGHEFGDGTGTPPPELPTLLTTAELERVEPIFRDITFVRFAFEIRLGHHLAYFRTYASPRVAGLLAHTGHVEHNPLKRATDTGLLTYELFHHGLNSPTGIRIVERLNAMHHRWKIRNDDYLWTLGTFVVLGPQIIDRYGWRKLTDEERQAHVDWYRELGTRMGMTDIPTNYQDFEDSFREYEEANLRRTDYGQRLFAASNSVALSALPRALRPIAKQTTAVLTDEPARTALGYPTPNRVTSSLVKTALLGRGIAKRNPEDGSPIFTPGGKYEVYPDGYTVDDLGVRQGRAGNQASSS